MSDHAREKNLSLPPAIGEGTPTLKSLAAFLGWPSGMTEADIYDFAIQREFLVRRAQIELETHKSYAPTAGEAISERIAALKALAPPSERGEGTPRTCGIEDPKRRAWCVLGEGHGGKHVDSWGKKFAASLKSERWEGTPRPQGEQD